MRVAEGGDAAVRGEGMHAWDIPSLFISTEHLRHRFKSRAMI